MTNPNLGGREVTNDSRLREVALIIADDLIGICETATKVAHRTGNTFVIDRQRTASMIQGRIASLNKSNPNEHQPHAGGQEDNEAVLPCDVRLPPATTIRKGVKVSTLMLAIKQREKYDAEDLEFKHSANAETRPSESAGSTPPASTDGAVGSVKP